MPDMHSHALVSFALDREGRVLATGSSGGDEAEMPVTGVVLWDVRSGRPLHSVAVEGGIGLPDQLRNGLQFSPSGKLLGYNYFTNAVGVLDVQAGTVILQAHPSIDDGPPAFVLGDDLAFFGSTSALNCSDDALGTIAPVRGGQLTCFAGKNVSGSLHPVAFRNGVIHGVSESKLRSVDASTGALVREQPLLPNASGDEWWRFAQSGRWLAAAAEDPRQGTPAVAGVTLIDLDSGQVLVTDVGLRRVNGVTFDANGQRWAAVQASREVGSPKTHKAVLFEGARRLGEIAGPFEPIDWMSFADGLPFTFSPDGKQALLLRPAGRVERWQVDDLGRAPTVLPRLDGVEGLAWPAPDLAIAIGPRVLYFLAMPAGEVIARHSFPE
jgi:hypothetical protein